MNDYNFKVYRMMVILVNTTHSKFKNKVNELEMHKESLDIELKNKGDSHTRELSFIKEKHGNEINETREKLKERDNSIDILSKQLQSEKQTNSVEINKLMSKLSMYESERVDQENEEISNNKDNRNTTNCKATTNTTEENNNLKSMIWAMFKDLKELKQKDILYEHRLEATNKIAQLDKQYQNIFNDLKTSSEQMMEKMKKR